MTAHLENILVVALEQAVAAPLCTSRLAAAGARVIKVERPEGDFARQYDHVVRGESAYFVWLNRGKESIVMDFKDPGDAALLEAMIARADVFIQNLAPGAAARAGFESADLRARYPRLITCDISGYGESGPWADMKAYDFLIQCEAGLASVTGAPHNPARVGVSVADIGCGMNAHAAILEALYQRERTGNGSGVAISLFDSLADWMSVPLLHSDYGGKAPERSGMHHPSIAPYGAYKVAGGSVIVVAVQNEREWRTFCQSVLGDGTLADRPEFANNSMRCANRCALDLAINNVLGSLSASEVRQRLLAARIAFGTVNGVVELSAHSQLRRIPVKTPSGTIEIPAPPVRWAEGDEEVLLSTPALNEHGEKLRGEFAR